MIRWSLPLLGAGLLVLLVGCETSGPAAPPCDITLDNIDGLWVSLKGEGTGDDIPDKFARVKFFTEDGKQKAIYTAGRLQEGNPATNKYTYEFSERKDVTSDLGTNTHLLYTTPGPAMKGKSAQRIERLKKDNRRLDLVFEGRLYVELNERRCRLQIGDFFVTYVKGESFEDSNPTGTREYARSEVELGMVACKDPRALIGFETEVIDLEKDKALNPNDGIYAEDEVWFHFLPPLYEDDEKRAKQLAEAHITPEEGCTYDMDLWAQDLRVKGKQKVPASIDEETKRVNWRISHTFEKSSADGIYLEMHRYKTCGGKRELVGGTCNVLKPNRSRAELEAAEKEAEAEAAKKAAEGGKEGAE